MRYQRLSSKLIRSLSIFIFVTALIACSTTPEYKESSFDPEQVKKMAFKFENSSIFLGITLPQAQIGKNVASNLSQWGYQFIEQPTEEFTHDMTINIGSISRGSTPPGFSFSSGNSDPRALNFQKATILPITCSLMPKGQQQLRAELIMEVLATEYMVSNGIPISQEQMIDHITEDISTACYNLLSSLRIKTLQNKIPAETIKPEWIPEIRIEVENEVEAVDIKTAVPVEKDVSTISSTAKEKNVPKENKVKKIIEAPRKRIIIHNQGSPVIFKFGYERK